MILYPQPCEIIHQGPIPAAPHTPRTGADRLRLSGARRRRFLLVIRSTQVFTNLFYTPSTAAPLCGLSVAGAQNAVESLHKGSKQSRYASSEYLANIRRLAWHVRLAELFTIPCGIVVTYRGGLAMVFFWLDDVMRYDIPTTKILERFCRQPVLSSYISHAASRCIQLWRSRGYAKKKGRQGPIYYTPRCNEDLALLRGRLRQCQRRKDHHQRARRGKRLSSSCRSGAYHDAVFLPDTATLREYQQSAKVARRLVSKRSITSAWKSEMA